MEAINLGKNFIRTTHRPFNKKEPGCNVYMPAPSDPDFPPSARTHNTESLTPGYPSRVVSGRHYTAQKAAGDPYVRSSAEADCH